MSSSVGGSVAAVTPKLDKQLLSHTVIRQLVMREDVSDFYFISLMPDKQLLQIVCSYYGVSNVSQHIFVEYEFWIA